MKLYGRYGAYTPRTAEERAKARRQAAARAAKSAAAYAWLEKHRWCINGCGREAAFYGPGQSLRFDGACSMECLAAFQLRTQKADDESMD